MIKQWIEKQIQMEAADHLEELGLQWPQGFKIRIEQPAHVEHGDYSTNIAMQLAKHLRKAPLQIASGLHSRLVHSEHLKQVISKMEVAPPGFINFYLNWEGWAKLSAESINASKNMQKAVIEHTSINPNKSAHIGHLRNSCIGDTIARMLQRAGFDVEVHNYIDDLGNQLADTVVGILHTSTNHEYVRFGDFCWDTYAKVNKAYKENPALLEERTTTLHALEEGRSNLSWLGMLVAERIVREHLEEMKQFGIRYDVLVWESSIVREGFWSSAFALLEQTESFYQESDGKLAGCWVLKQQTDQVGDIDPGTDHHSEKVLVRSNGILTYTAKDIAYHLWKFGLLDKDFTYKKFADGLWTTYANGTKKRFGHADTVINVIDHRQQYPQAMVKQALEALGYQKQAEHLRHVSYGVVSLSPDTATSLGIDTSDGKGSYAMSGRQGVGIKVSEFLDQMEQVIEHKRSRKTGLSSRSIAAAAIRYYLLRFHLQTEVVFDIQQATEVSGNTGVYLMYAYARAVSILNKAEKQYGLSPSIPKELGNLEPQEYTLLRQIAYWPETLDSAVQELAPNAICNYAYELATLFNNFYASCPILKANEHQQKFRIWLTAKYKETLADALQILGIPTPNRM